MLARGELHTIGATTLDEYRKHIEKDAALERRFQPILIDQPSVEETISILRGLRERYEVHHGVRITDSALVAAATLSDRYISERFLPDKAIDLVDEAASRLRMQIDSMPIELDELERRRIQLEIEREALRKETDDASKARLDALEKELADIEEASGAMKQRWESEKAAIAAIRATKAELEALTTRIEQAEREADYATAAELKYGTLKELTDRMTEQEATLIALQGPGSLLKEEVSADDIAEIVGAWTGIPSTASSRARPTSSSTWRNASTSGWSARTRRSRPSPTRSAAPVPGSRTRAGRSARSCSSARPASARPRPPARSPSSCSTTRPRWSAST
jgi:ATP-dependent Clp protease ATP-binding subunit ClpB